MTAVRHLTVADLAARCGVARKTVYRWNSEGTGPLRIRVGGRRVAYRETDVAAWEAKREVPAADEHTREAWRRASARYRSRRKAVA